MNSLAKLIDDLDLDEALVLKCLIRHGLVSPSCRYASEVANSDCEEARQIVLQVLSEDCDQALKALSQSGGGGR